MVERDVVLAKAATIDRCLARVAEVRGRPGGALLPIDVEDLVVLNITRASHAAADLAAHVVASEGYGLADTLAAAFTILEKHGIIEADLAAKLRAAAGFRNVAVHAYQAVDARIVDAIATHHVADLRAFAAKMVARYAG
ncbi:MAG TPA: DUF86 domain-containing protein [Polyangiaceae bacterium]|jgi:uncharacterized protein YutE (UPF0331/DUF86 family)